MKRGEKVEKKGKADLCREFGLINSTIEKICKNRTKIPCAFWNELNRSRIKQLGKPESGDVNEALFKWFRQQRTDSVPVSGSYININFVFPDGLPHRDVESLTGVLRTRLNTEWLVINYLRQIHSNMTTTSMYAVCGTYVTHDGKQKLFDLKLNFSSKDLNGTQNL